jgi:Protein of unknown function (DUF4012)
MRWRSAPRGPRLIAALLAAILLVGSATAALGYFVARPWEQQFQASVERDLQAGAAELQLGTDAVRKANQDHNAALLDQALAHFTKSRADFQRASSRVQDEWAIRGGEIVPLIGTGYLKPRVDIVTDVAMMGEALNDAGVETAGVDRQLLAPSDKDLHGGQRLIAVLTSAGPSLTKIRADITRAGTAAGLVDTRLLPAAQQKTFAKAREQIKTGLAGIVEFQQLAPVLLEILGANGARSYLIEQVDPAELRGGGGFIGSYSLLSADHGILKLGKSGDVGSIDIPYPLVGGKKYIAPPNSSLQFTQHGWVFGDSNFTADFPTNARAGEQLFLSETGTSVDGVISIDPNAVAALLQATGPIAIPEYKTTAQASTFAEEVFQREEKLVNIVVGKKNFFPIVAERLIDKIANLPTDAWPNLLSILNGTVEARHLQVYFNNAPSESEMDRIGWAGNTVTPSAGRELMLEVESNYAATKANHFVTRSFDLTITNESGKLHHHLIINLKNATPAGYLGGRGYIDYLRFYYSGSLADAVMQNISPGHYPSDEKPTGAKLADGWLNLEIRNLKLGYSTAQVVIDYTTDMSNSAHPYEIYWQKQAGTLSDKIHVTYKTGTRTFSTDSDLSQDRLLTLTAQGLDVKAGNVPTAHLPNLGG